MKLITSILSIAISFFLLSCGPNKSDQHGNNATQQEEHQHNAEATIELNNGEKWKVNSEMIPNIIESEELLNNYDGNDYKSLAEQLKDKNNALISSCTMEGKSHDELHKWLHPHLELVSKLSKAKDKEQAEEIITELQKSFQTYKTYFQ